MMGRIGVNVAKSSGEGGLQEEYRWASAASFVGYLSALFAGCRYFYHSSNVIRITIIDITHARTISVKRT